MVSRETEYVSLTNFSIRRRSKKTNLVLIILVIAGIFYITSLYLNDNEPSTVNKPTSTDDSLPIGFMNLYTNGTLGPITVNREKDDGNKVNIYQSLRNVTDNQLDNFMYDYEGLKNEKISKPDEYTCENSNEVHELTCPLFYHIVIDYAFYGRHAKDSQHCITNAKGEKLPYSTIKKFRDMAEECGEHFTHEVHNMCKEQSDCRIIASNTLFKDTCPGYIKYLHVKYHCEKDTEFKLPNFAIVMFANKIESNSIYEHSTSEFYQYAKAHGYKFFFNSKRYDTLRNLFYMKLHVLTEAIIEGLKTEEFGWVFWVDSDTLLANPNIRLETFIPIDNNVHYIATADQNGLNAGVFLIRVHPWSLNFLMRAISYHYYYPNEKLFFSDQTSMNNALVRGKDEKHYVIVPQQWFNKYHHRRSAGDFLYHFAGRKDKTGESNAVRKEVYGNSKWYEGLTNKKMRQTVINYYNLPRNEQYKNGEFHLDDS